jgi:hypothetical protein
MEIVTNTATDAASSTVFVTEAEINSVAATVSSTATDVISVTTMATEVQTDVTTSK